MDSTLAILLAVLACTFIGMVAAIIAATNRPTHAPKPKAVATMQAKSDGMPIEWRDVPVRAIPQDSVRYRGVVVVTRHIDVRFPIK